MVSNTALVLEGGGFRAMYSSGVLDALLKHEIYLPYCVGVSAGAAYGISYVSRQYERNRTVNLNYTADPRYMSWGNFIRKGNLFDWDFVYGEIPKHLIPLDFETIARSSTQFYVGVTNVCTGRPEYLHANPLGPDDLMTVVTASSSLPFVSKMTHYKKSLYMDGGISDSIPIVKAMNDGFNKQIVVLTRNDDYRKEAGRFATFIKFRYRKYPHLVEAVLKRHIKYNATLDLIDKLELEGKVFVIRARQTIKVSRIENNPQKLDQLYMQGVNDTTVLMPRLKEWLS